MSDTFDSEISKLITGISDSGLRVSPLAERTVKHELATHLDSGGINVETGLIRGSGEETVVYDLPQFDRDMSQLAEEIVEAAHADGASIVTPDHIQEGFAHTEWSFWPFTGGKRGV